MQLTKQQKAGMAAAALAVGVLGVDRFVLGTGGPASASAQQAVVVGADAVQAEGPKPKAQAESGPTFAQRLDGFASARGIDPTRADVGLFGTAAPEVWTASAVIGVGQGGALRIGERLVRVGETYRGAELVSVDRRGGVFREGERVFRADLPLREDPGRGDR
jgi:hypothetical protein